MRCEICNRIEDETRLFKGISDGEIINVCENCAELENIPLLKKPSTEQLNTAEAIPSVRERLERLSGLRKPTREQLVVQGNLARLRVPPIKQESDKLIENYDWAVKVARRRKKLTLNNLSQQISIPLQELEDFEKGLLPKGFEQIALKLEPVLGVKLLKEHPTEISFFRRKDQETEILKTVKQKMQSPSGEKEEEKSAKKEKIKMMQSGNFDFSKPEHVKDITLKDLVELKKQREKQEHVKKSQKAHEALFGSDIDIEEV